MDEELARTHNSAGLTTGAAVAVGVLCGIALGAALGVMFAPTPGHATRRKMADRVNRARRQASSTMSDVASRGRRAFKAGREAFTATDAATLPWEPVSMSNR